MSDGRVLLPRLQATPSDAARELLRARTRSDLAAVLEIDDADLIYILYRGKEKYAYREFTIGKKGRRGESRIIRAPHPTVKILQRKLSSILGELYQPTRNAQGYVVGRSIVTNARQHEGKKWVLNVDLEGFFPSINFGRVRGLLIKGYRISDPVATVIAQICTHVNELPQGAPTSPIISNMICLKLDGQLHALARESGCWYTRYADDLTFSTRLPAFPEQLAIVENGEVDLGSAITEIVAANGFRVNPRKTWLKSNDRRQMVTGLIVNEAANVPRRYLRRLRAMMYQLEDDARGSEAAFAKRDESSQRYPGAPAPSMHQSVRGMIEYVGMVRGSDDALYNSLLDRYEKIVPAPPRRRRTARRKG